MTQLNRDWGYAYRPRKDHEGRPLLILLALAGCGLAWVGLIAAVLSLA